MEHWTEQVVLHTICSIGHWDDNDLPPQICPLDHPHIFMLICIITNKTDLKVLGWARVIKVVVQLSYSQHMAVILAIDWYISFGTMPLNTTGHVYRRKVRNSVAFHQLRSSR